MSKISFKERVYLKGKESTVVGVLLILALIIFIVPILSILLLRYFYRQISKIGAKAKSQAETNAAFLLNSRVE